MTVRRRRDPEPTETRRKAATSPEERDNQLISAAVDLAEKQILAGTAAAQVITHYLKLGSSRERLEQERIRLENELLVVKAEAAASSIRQEEMYKEALNAMRRYSGQEPLSEQDEFYD